MPDTKSRALAEILELARIEHARWPGRTAALRAAGVPLALEDEKEDTVEDLTLLQQLSAKRAKDLDEIAALIETRTKARGDFETRTQTFEALTAPTDEEKTADTEARSAFTVAEEAFLEDFGKREAALKHLDQRIAEQEVLEQRRQAAADASRGDARVVSEPATYREDNGKEISYFRDLCMVEPKIAQAMGGNHAEARERLDNHAKDTDAWIKRRAGERERRATEQIDRAEREHALSRGLQARGFDASPFEMRVNPNRTPGQGGTFVPPLWLIEDYIPALRGGRVTADLCRGMELPEGTDSINIPAISTPTRVGIQGQDGAAVTSQDMTDTSVQANVKTLAGQEDVAIQLLEQSPGQIMDRVIVEDLMADYNLRLNQNVVFGNGSGSGSLNGGQVKGIFPSTNWGATVVATAVAAAGSGQAFNQTLGALASKTAYGRYSLANFKYLLHPRRWFWFATALDGASGTVGRPLVNQSDDAFNVSAIAAAMAVEQGYIGRSMLGPDVFIDSAVPTTDNGSNGTGTFDVAFGAKWDDAWLFEGNLRTRVLPEVLSGTLEVRFQVYNYVAFLVRYGASIAIAQGAGLGAPTGSIDTAMTF